MEEPKSKLSKIYLTGGGEGAVGILHDGTTVTKNSPPPLKVAVSKPLCEQSRAARQQTSRQPASFDEAVLTVLNEGGADPRQAIQLASERWPALWKAYQAELLNPYE